MTLDEIRVAWFKAKVGILNESDLRYVGSGRFLDREWLFYECPCGGDDHLAMRAVEEEGLSKHRSVVLNCFCQGVQWLVRPVDVASIIKTEEEKYLRLQERAPAIVEKIVAERGMSEDTLPFLSDTHGIDRDTAMELCKVQPQG